MNSLTKTTTTTTERVISLIDMDCFYVQVEEVAAPEFRGKPCGVSQYNPYKGGGLIAVNYEARKFGVKRGMRGEDAKSLCPDFHTFLFKKKELFDLGKADLSKYRDASMKIFDILGKHFKNVEKASIDEAYIDLTDAALAELANEVLPVSEENEKEDKLVADSFVVGTFVTMNEDGSLDQANNLKAWLKSVETSEPNSNERLLVTGARLIQRVRREIFNSLGFHCSAGIAHNKTLAKLCAGINKPNRQTILPLSSIQELYKRTPINKIKNLGGKLGMMLTEGLELNTMAQLAQKSLGELVEIFGEKTGNWLYQISKGVDVEPVMSRRSAKSIGCSKNFRGNQVLNTFSKVEYWVRNLCEELEERLESDKLMNQRDASLLVLHLTNEAGTFSKSIALTNPSTACCSKKFTTLTLDMLAGFNKSKIKNQWHPIIYTLGLSATKFVIKNTSNSIQRYLIKKTSSSRLSDESVKNKEVNQEVNQEDEEDLGVEEEGGEQIISEMNEENDILVDLDVECPGKLSPKPGNEEITTNDVSCEVIQYEKATTETIKENRNDKKSTESDSTRKKASKLETSSKIDIKSLLIKQAEKATTSNRVVSCEETKPDSKSLAKQKNNDLKTMLLKQAEKAVIACNKENVNDDDEVQIEPPQTSKTIIGEKNNKSNKTDLKEMLIKQADKAQKYRQVNAPARIKRALIDVPSKESRKDDETVKTPRRTPPEIISLIDDDEEDDFAAIRKSINARLSRSSKKLEQSKKTPASKRQSIELTPVKGNAAVKNKKPKNSL